MNFDEKEVESDGRLKINNHFISSYIFVDLVDFCESIG